MRFSNNKIRIFTLLVVISIIIANFTLLSGFFINSFNKKKTDSLNYYKPMTNAQDITIITPENKTYTESMSGYYPATYGFVALRMNGSLLKMAVL